MCSSKRVARAPVRKSVCDRCATLETRRATAAVQLYVRASPAIQAVAREPKPLSTGVKWLCARSVCFRTEAIRAAVQINPPAPEVPQKAPLVQSRAAAH